MAVLIAAFGVGCAAPFIEGQEWIPLKNLPAPVGKVAMSGDGYKILLVGESSSGGTGQTYLFDIGYGTWDAVDPIAM